MARPKRTAEELANKSDSDDDDYSDRPVRTRKPASRSKATRKAQPPKKKRRADSDDDLLADGDDSSELDDLSSLPESEPEEEPEAERNARGIPSRSATKKRPAYNEDSSSAENDAEEEASEPETPKPKERKSKTITLKVPGAALQQPADNYLPTRRSTRQTRASTEDMFALTHSGHHMQPVGRATHSPEAAASKGSRRGSRSTRASMRATAQEEEVARANQHEMEVIDETTMDVRGSQVEVLESDLQNEVQDGDQAIGDDEEANHQADDVGFVPESENGDAKADDAENNETGSVEEDDEDDEGPTTRRRSRPTQNEQADEEPQPVEEEEGVRPRRSSRRSKEAPKNSQRKRDDESDFEPEEGESNDEDEVSGSDAGGSPRKESQPREEEDDSVPTRRSGLRRRQPRSAAQSDADGDVAEELAEELDDLRDRPHRRRVQPEIVYEKPRRSRKDVDYRIIRPDLVLPMEEAENEVTESPSRRARGGGGAWQRTLFPTYGPFGGGGPTAILGPAGAPPAAGGADSDSSDDEVQQHPKSAGPAAVPPGTGFLPSAQTHGADAAQGPSGTPANLGKVKDKQALADADPLGVDLNVNFDSVGGLQGHIDQLKEMVSLPLLYPEVFQRFHIVPPRGVLFHGPPGTGKTLLARALANSVSSEGRKVTFYMRKGADALSKWVGEAERQLRLLFDEARKTQPSIIFFDEIDGLAPVRSSKQEQIHSSIVSTLLALMDGMDGRGQVIVIGATNRPDTVDPALRRPGRFDREFYFPLPSNEGRRSILDIHTKGWDPPLPGNIKDELAEITKGYGGADLRALCTEAALNAVQRKYPQIYKSNQKLLIDPKKIDVTPKDFMLAITKMVPSSERATSSGASPLPNTVEPLLRRPLAEIKELLSEVLPHRRRLTALEEAQFEEPENSGNFRREQMQREFDQSRVFRPRILLRGSQGMGQQYLAAAVLHHFEGFHVQAFDLPTLLSDSARSPEAAVIQLFAEVKRHKPSVIYIPNIQSWSETVGPTVLSTFMGLLRSIPPSDPVLLFGVLELIGEEVDVSLLRNLFGFSKKNFCDLKAPDHVARHEFFGRLIDYIKTAPSEFPDPENRKRRELEPLEVAPPPPEKPASPPTKEQLKAQKKKDHQTLNLLKIRIQPIMDQIKKYKRFRSGPIDESHIRYLWEEDDPFVVTSDLPVEQQETLRPFEKAYDKHGVLGLREAASGKFFYNMEIVTIEKRLSNGYYKRPNDFLADIKRLAKDARQLGEQERLLRANELLSNVEVDIGNIEQMEPGLVAECESVYLRELEREKTARERAQRAEEEENARHRAADANVPHGNTESGPSTGPVVLGESIPNGDPRTPPRRSTVNFLTNGYHQGGGGSDLNDTNAHGDGNDDSHPSRGNDGDVYMTNSEEQSGERETQNSSFGPSAQPKPAYSHTAPSQQVRRESGLSSFSQKGPMTPMAPGSQPNDYTNEASTTQTTEKKSSDQSSVPQQHAQSFMAGQGSRQECPDLTQYPDRVSQEENLPDTQQGASSQPSPRPRESLSTAEYANSQASPPAGSQSQPKQQPPVPLFDASKQPSHTPTNVQSLLNNEEPPSKLVVDDQYIGMLHEQLTQRTSGCSVEQLEQINTGLMDSVWRLRGEWNRTRVTGQVIEAFNEVLEDMQAMQDMGPVSQKTREQLGGSF